MRTLTCLALSLALSACGDDGSATSITSASTTSSDTTQDPPSSEPASSSTTTGTNPTTSGDDISASGTTTAEPLTTSTSPSTTDLPATTTVDTSTSSTSSTTGTTADDTTADASTTDDTTTGVLLGCGFEGPKLDATLVHDGVPPPPCGTVEFKGQNIKMMPGPVYELDGCACGAACFAPDPWTFSLTVPADNLPVTMPECPRIVMQRQMGKAGCELVGVAIWETANNDMPLPWYIAGSLLGPIDAVKNDLEVEQLTAETCDCDFCCTSPERYDLEFTGLGGQDTVAEDSMGTLMAPNSAFHYDITNYQSHLSGICDDPPAIDWIVSLQK